MKGCKKCPAFAKCTVTYRSSACAALRWTYGIDTDPEIITNADQIRAMSDEELAKMLNDDIEYCHSGFCLEDETCYKCLLKWLQQPARDR